MASPRPADAGPRRRGRGPVPSGGGASSSPEDGPPGARRRRRLWRRLAAGLVVATALSWLVPRVAAAATAALVEDGASAAAAAAGAAAETAEAAALAVGGAAATAAATAVSAARSPPPSSSSLIRPLGTLQVVPTRAELELSLRLLFASLGGAAVGLERSSADRPAGVRTMALVSLGAAAFTLCSMYGFMSVGALVGPDGPTTKYDPSRMASNVASGVGFIGAGVITNNRKAAGVYDRQSTVGGLTTAAAIWTSAAIGVACGVGLYFIGMSAAVSTIVILRFGQIKNSEWGKRVFTVGRKKKKKSEATAAAAAAAAAVVVDGKAPAEGTANATASAATAEEDGLAGDGIAKPKHVAYAWKDDGGAGGRRDQRLEGIGEHEVAGREEETAEMDVAGKGDGAPPVPSGVDPLLEKYLWGVDAPAADKQGNRLQPRLSIEEEQEVVLRDSKGKGKSSSKGREAGP